MNRSNSHISIGRRIRRRLPALVASALLAATATACFTGVESTPVISESDVRRARIPDRPEAHYLDSIAPEPPARWQRGKLLTVTDDRLARLLGPEAALLGPLGGRTIAYVGADEVTSITGSPVAELTFALVDNAANPDGATLTYRTYYSLDSLARRRALDLPFTVEHSVVDALRRRLAGNTYYVNTAHWQDLAGQTIRGLKYIAVRVDSVRPGRGVYPVEMVMSYSTDGIDNAPGAPDSAAGRARFILPLSLSTAPGAVMTFADQLSLTDPRLRYPRIEPERWMIIARGAVVAGMTRDECRLSLGNPDRLERLPGSDTLYERWTYADGVTLTFADGLLTSYRK